MTTTLPTRAEIDAAPPLDFGQPKAQKRRRAVTVQMCYHGALVSFSFDAETNITRHEIEQSIDTLLKADGWSAIPTPQAAANGAKKAAERREPAYNDNGEAICPVHRKPLKQGQYGWYCSAKAKEGEAANDKGYCSIRFTE